MRESIDLSCTSPFNERRPPRSCGLQKNTRPMALVRRNRPESLFDLSGTNNGGAGRLLKRTAVAGRTVVGSL